MRNLNRCKKLAENVYREKSKKWPAALQRLQKLRTTRPPQTSWQSRTRLKSIIPSGRLRNLFKVLHLRGWQRALWDPLPALPKVCIVLLYPLKYTTVEKVGELSREHCELNPQTGSGSLSSLGNGKQKANGKIQSVECSIWSLKICWFKHPDKQLAQNINIQF